MRVRPTAYAGGQCENDMNVSTTIDGNNREGILDTCAGRKRFDYAVCPRRSAIGRSEKMELIGAPRGRVGGVDISVVLIDPNIVLTTKSCEREQHCRRGPCLSGVSRFGEPDRRIYGCLVEGHVTGLRAIG